MLGAGVISAIRGRGLGPISERNHDISRVDAAADRLLTQCGFAEGTIELNEQGWHGARQGEELRPRWCRDDELPRAWNDPAEAPWVISQEAHGLVARHDTFDAGMRGEPFAEPIRIRTEFPEPRPDLRFAL